MNKNDLQDKLSVMDKMLVSLVEILEEKKIITNEEWEKRIEQKINEAVSLIKMR